MSGVRHAHTRTGGRRKDGRRVPSGMKGKGYTQDIHTPEVVCDVIYAFCGGKPDLDAFGSPLQTLRALTVFYPPSSRRLARAREALGPARFDFLPRDGWIEPWFGTTFANPEFEHLGRALERAWREVHRKGGAFEALILGPIRTHRNYAPWFWAANECCFMKPIAFVGHKNQFSLPLGLAYYGPRGIEFRRHASALGVVRSLTPWTKRIIMPPMSEGMNLAADLEQRKKALIIAMARDNPTLSIQQLLTALDLLEGSDEARILLNTPLGELVAPAPAEERPTIRIALRGRAASDDEAKPRNSKGLKPPTNKAKAKTAVAKKANGTNGHARGKESQVPARIEAFLAKYKKGDTFKTSEVIEAAKVGRAATLKHLDGVKRIAMYGSGRGAEWHVTA
jgi:hypothetical protein